MLSHIVRFLLVGLAYAFVSWMGVLVIIKPEEISVFWPGSGLLLGYLLVAPRRAWVSALTGAFVGNLLVNLAIGHMLFVSIGFAIENVIEPMLIASFILWWSPRSVKLEQSYDLFLLIVVSAVGCGVMALFGTAVLSVNNAIPFWSVWRLWWLGDLLGGVIFAPFVLVLANSKFQKNVPPKNILEQFVLSLGMLSFAWFGFVSDLHVQYPTLFQPYFMFPVLIVMALRYDLRLCLAVTTVVCLIAVYGTLEGRPFPQFAEQSLANQVLVTQTFLAIICLITLVIGITIHAGREREAEVRELLNTIAKRSEEERSLSSHLRESEERFQAIFHAQFQFIGLMSPDGVLLEANRTALASAGASENDVIGKPFWETAWWTHDPQQQEKLKQATVVAAGGEQVRFEASHPTGTGGLIWVDFSLTPFRDQSGQVILLIPEGRDITERKRIENELRETELRHRLAIEGTGLGTWNWHLPSGRIEADRRYLEMIGYTEEEFPPTADSWQKLVHPDDLQVILKFFEEDFSRKVTIFSTEYRMRHREGRWIWILDSGCILERDAQGNPVRMCGIHLDVTARREAEEALKISEARYRSVVKALAEGIVLQQSSGEIIAWNERACAILGLSEDQIRGRTSVDPRWRAVRPSGESFPGDQHPSMVAMLTGEPVFNTVMGIEKPDGEKTWVSINAVPLCLDGDNKIDAVVASFHDITESHRLNKQIMASLHEKEVLLREIHHRVKNNLAVIISLLNMQTRYAKESPVVNILHEARHRVSSMALIHEHLYNSADLGAVNFGEYVGVLANQLLQFYSVNKPKITLSIQTQPAKLELDQAIPTGLILNELITNALKHAFPKENSGTISIQLKESGETCTLWVRDNGVGLSQEISAGRPQSLGMRLIHTLTAQIDGQIEFRTLFPGTEVQLTIPARRS